MAKNKKNYYAVARGRKPGLYKTWEETEKQVKDYEGARFKGFHDLGDALDWLREHGLRVPEHATYEQPATDVDEDRVQIYTDGSAIRNPGPGGYGVVMLYQGRRKELSAGFRQTTNNRMELMACIAALQALKKISRVTLFSDSKYVIDSLNNGWAQRWRLNGWKTETKKIVENVDLWRLLLDEIARHDVQLIWVKGHGGKPENERCDELAQTAARAENLAVDAGYEDNPNLSLF
ncbi:ribonuclease HI [candidate division KSB1 bacterium]|nr:ribonuclease HI [candidate division KSB1 bacterium]